MHSFDKIMEIRKLFYMDGLSINEISRRTGCAYKTVQKYIDQTDFSSTPQFKKDIVLCPKLDPWKPQIDKWLKDDRDLPRKQRHTALRVFERLEQECDGFNCSYRTVAKYVGYVKDSLNMKRDDPKIPLEHHPGECQGDFGTAEFIEDGKRITGKYFVLDFPYSNCAFAQLKYGENMECLLEAMDAIFRYIGGVPPVIWLDNASTMIKKVICGGGRKITERFQRFAEHYRFVPIFMNPASGNEKGAVEAKVGYIRRHMLVPPPQFSDINDFNDHFFQLQENDLERYHYRKNKMISSLFLDDMRQLLPLPEKDFDLCGYRTYKTDQTALFTVDGKYTYSTHPDLRRKNVMIRFTSSTVTVLDDHNKIVTVHKRLYGEESGTSVNWIPYLRALAQKPRSFLNTSFANTLPEEMRVFLLNCENRDRGRILTVMADLNDQKGFEAVRDLVSKSIAMNISHPDDFEMLYRRLYMDIPVFPDISVYEHSQNMPKMRVDLTQYDDYLNGGKKK